ncbi:MAG: MoaD/ThiS family protein [Thermoplasmata archaeon]|nr:MoaD/ThiS family protein [Thermoplasmata archaeon]
MKLKILYFGIFRDITGKINETIDFNGKDLEDLKKYLNEKYPNIVNENFIVSINYKYVDGNEKLKENDEIAIMSPVSGG